MSSRFSGIFERHRHHEQVAREAQRVGVDLHHPGAVVIARDGTDRLQRLRAGAVPVQAIGDDERRRPRSPRRRRRTRTRAGSRCWSPAPRAPAAPVLERLLGVTQHRQRLVLDLDQVACVLGDVAAGGDDRRDALADVADLVGGQQTPHVLVGGGPEVGQRVRQFHRFGAGDHRHHAVQRTRPRRRRSRRSSRGRAGCGRSPRAASRRLAGRRHSCRGPAGTSGPRAGGSTCRPICVRRARGRAAPGWRS